MTHNIYQNSKMLLISEAKMIKKSNPTDLPMIRQHINDQADQIRRQINHYALTETISQAQAKQYCNWIDALACRLHPKTKN